MHSVAVVTCSASVDGAPILEVELIDETVNICIMIQVQIV